MLRTVDTASACSGMRVMPTEPEDRGLKVVSKIQGMLSKKDA